MGVTSGTGVKLRLQTPVVVNPGEKTQAEGSQTTSYTLYGIGQADRQRTICSPLTFVPIYALESVLTTPIGPYEHICLDLPGRINTKQSGWRCFFGMQHDESKVG